MDKSLYTKKTLLGSIRRYDRNIELIEKISSSDIVLKSPFYKDTVIGSPTTAISGSYNVETKVASGTVTVKLSTVNLKEEYATFFSDATLEAATVLSDIRIVFGKYIDGRFVDLHSHAPKQASTYTNTTGTAVPTTEIPTITFSISIPYATQVKFIRVYVLTNIGGKIYEVGCLERECHLDTFFSQSGTSNIAAMMTETDGLSLSLKLHKVIDYEKFKTDGTTVKSYFKSEGDTVAIVSFITPELAQDEFLILTLTNTAFTSTDFINSVGIAQYELSGYAGDVPRLKGGGSIGFEQLCNSKDEQGHRGMFVTLITANNNQGMDSFSDEKDIPIESGLPATSYKPWFTRYFRMKDIGNRTYIPLGGLHKNATYEMRLHVCRFSYDKVFDIGGKSLWDGINIDTIPDSGTYWVDGVHRAWKDPNSSAPAGFWSNRAYRRLYLCPSFVIDSSDTKVDIKTHVSILNYGIPINPEVVITDNDLSDPPTTATLTWKTSKTYSLPESWYIGINIPKYSVNYIWNISSDEQSAVDIHPKIPALDYDISSDSSYYYHTVEVSTYQALLPVDVSFCIVGSVDKWLY